MVHRQGNLKGNSVGRLKVYGRKFKSRERRTVYKAPVQGHPMMHGVSRAPVRYSVT